MRQIATAFDDTGYEVSGDSGSAELYEDGAMVVSVATFREARTAAQERTQARLEAANLAGVGLPTRLDWRTERD
jgi:hypothetical protein